MRSYTMIGCWIFFLLFAAEHCHLVMLRFGKRLIVANATGWKQESQVLQKKCYYGKCYFVSKFRVGLAVILRPGCSSIWGGTAGWVPYATDKAMMVSASQVLDILQNWVVVSNIFFHPYLGKVSILTNIFQRG